MRTRKKSIESPPSFYVNGIQAGTVKIKYQKTVASVYDKRCDSTISCYSTLSCYNMVHDHEQEFEHFHSQEHGFFVTEIENDNVKYSIHSLKMSPLKGKTMCCFMDQMLYLALKKIVRISYNWVFQTHQFMM
jgi:hypothetical protein